MRALWIEMLLLAIRFRHLLSRPVRALWIEMDHHPVNAYWIKSRPVRALWIEIAQAVAEEMDGLVEAREGLVD